MAASDRIGVGREHPEIADIRAWLVDEVAALVRVSPDEIDVHEPFVRFGIGSAQALELAARLEDWMGFPLSPTLIWDYPSIERLARHLADPSASADVADCQDDE